jgi:DNA modification methylase
MIYIGDCLEVMKTMPDNSVDSIVTDPPYGLSFMGKRWDYDVPSVEIWAECLRVLKPGGHLLAFAGTRTQHRMACRIEDAGFEIRDMLAWVYGSGFPKSLDVSKALDKAGPPGQAPFAEFAAHYEERRKAQGMTHAQICASGGWHGAVNHGGSSTNWANGYGMPTVEQWQVLQPMLGLDARWEQRVQREQYEREKIAERASNRLAVAPGQGSNRSANVLDVTAPGSDAARQWAGWGTALKPALEPITLARKPLIGTVAANVAAHGTGGLNIDGCRITTNGEALREGAGGIPCRHDVDAPRGRSGELSADRRYTDAGGTDFAATPGPRGGDPLGRWPANLIHDGSDEVVVLFPNGEGRFFYTSKASRDDRNDGCDGMEERPLLWSSGTQSPGTFQAEGTKRAATNNHPTVKPTDLMRWLCRLVTPPGGIVLDPFMGSGSTGRGAIAEGFQFIGIEIAPQYAAIAEKRMRVQQPGLSF